MPEVGLEARRMIAFLSDNRGIKYSSINLFFTFLPIQQSY